MISKTKNLLTNAQVLQIFRAACGESIKSPEITELTGGYFNAAYQIADGESQYVLKIAPPPGVTVMSYEKDLMQGEATALELVQSLSDFPAPRLICKDFSHCHCDAGWILMEKMPGARFDDLRGSLSPEQQQDLLQQLGRCNARINTISGNRFGYPALPDSQGENWAEVFRSMLEMLFADAERIGMYPGTDPSEFWKLFDIFRSTFDEVKTPKLLHWDLWDGNVLVQDNAITGIIDFERALWGDPLMEAYFRPHSYCSDYNEGYGEDLRAKHPVRALFYDCYLYLIMTIETAYRQYPDDWQYHFATEHLQKAVQELKQIANR